MGLIKFTPDHLSGLSAWYKAENLISSYKEPPRISGLASWIRAKDLVNSAADPSQISGLTAHYSVGNLVATAVTDPTEISGLAAWYRADKNVIFSSGTSVEIWGDSSGSGDVNRDAVQATVANQPTYNSSDSSYNNQPTLSFTKASTQYMKSGTWASALTVPATIIVIGNMDNAATGEFMFDGIVSTNRMLVYNSSLANNWTAGAGSNISITTLNNSIPSVISAIFNGASSNLYVNSNYVGVSGNTGTSPSLTGLTIGAAYNAGGALNGKIAEIIVFDRVLSQSEIQSLSMYAAKRYGLSISIGTMTDSTGDSTHNLTQSTQSQQPTLVVSDSSYGNQPTLSFASANTQYLASGVWGADLPNPYTTVVIGNCDGTANIQVFHNGSGTNPTTNNATLTCANFPIASYYGSNPEGGGIYLTTQGALAVSASPVMISSVFQTSGSLYANSNKVAQSGSLAGASIHTFDIGADIANSRWYLNGKIAEVMIFNRALSQAEVQSLEMYAAKRYGLSISIGNMTDSAAPTDATHTLTQATQANQPTLTLSDSLYSNQPTLSFVGASSQYLKSSTWATAINEPFTMIVIGNDDGSGAPTAYLDGAASNSALLGDYQTGWGNGYLFYNGTGFANTQALISTTQRILSAVANGASSSLANNSNVSVTGTMAVGVPLQGLTVGAIGAGNGWYLNGKIAEVMVFNRALSQAEIQSLAMYAAVEYGVSISIGQWNDQSGSGDANKNLSQATQSAQPVLTPADTSYNKKASLSFSSAATQFIKSGTWITSLPIRTVIVIGNSDGAGSPANEYFLDGGSANENVIQLYSGNIQIYAGVALVATGTGAASANPTVIAGIFNSTSSALYINAKTAIATGNVGAQSMTGIDLGDHNGAGTYGLNGKICEVIVYNRALTATEINQILGYCGNEYGIALSWL